jgi:hypothetical protein
MTAARATRPLSTLIITNLTHAVRQDEILEITDDVNADHGIGHYIDGYCAIGARLSREYAGHGSLVVVSFAWDYPSKETRISLYGTNVVTGRAWTQDMTNALRSRFEVLIEPARK